ncbi:hypothetical protein [Lacipirellula sp.]|uniref:hypothetical protein n=1 Tax=Lacipirellula sp. TaxID=2691419 RepID=UPI003D139328
MLFQELLPLVLMMTGMGCIYIAFAERLAALARGLGLPDGLANPAFLRRVGIVSVIFGLAILLLPALL